MKVNKLKFIIINFFVIFGVIQSYSMEGIEKPKIENIKINWSYNKESLKDGENFDIPIGAFVSLGVSVLVDETPAQVISSSWDVQGEQIVAAEQDSDTGTATIVSGQSLTGDPDYISTAWIQEGFSSINIAGQFVWGGYEYPFNASGSVNVHAPQFTNLGDLTPSVSQPTFDFGALTTQFGTGVVNYTCDQFVQGGTIGFLQIINGLRYRGTFNDQGGIPAQQMGSIQQFIDMSEDGSLFYVSDTAIADGDINLNDAPSLRPEGEPQYTWYRVGSYFHPVTDMEDFATFLAYQAPSQDGMQSFIVTKNVTNWHWACEAEYKDHDGSGELRWDISSEKTRYNDDGVWNQTDEWSMPMWTSNSVNLRNWVNY